MTENKTIGRPKIGEKPRGIISAYIPEEDIATIKEQAKKSGKSVSAETASLIEEAVRRLTDGGQTKQED